MGLDNFDTGYQYNIDQAIEDANKISDKNLKDNFKFINGDIGNLDVCNEACYGVDYVLHQAALGSVPRSVKDPIGTNRANIDGFLNMLVASKDANVKRFVYAASSSTYGDHPDLPKVEDKTGKPLSPYAVTKVVNELYANVFAKTYGFKKEILAINEASLFRQSRQTVSLSLKIGTKVILKKLIGDGILVSTPAGSTAYNLSAQGPIIELNSKKLAVTPISPFRPRRWKGKIISDKKKIKIINLDPLKRPIAVVADNVEIRNVMSVDVKISKKIMFCLLYDKKRSLIKKIKLEQTRQNLL